MQTFTQTITCYRTINRRSAKAQRQNWQDTGTMARLDFDDLHLYDAPTLGLDIITQPGFFRSSSLRPGAVVLARTADGLAMLGCEVEIGASNGGVMIRIELHRPKIHRGSADNGNRVKLPRWWDYSSLCSLNPERGYLYLYGALGLSRETVMRRGFFNDSCLHDEDEILAVTASGFASLTCEVPYDRRGDIVTHGDITEEESRAERVLGPDERLASQVL